MKVWPATFTFHSTSCATEPFGRIPKRTFAHCPRLLTINANDIAKVRSNADAVVIFVVDLVKVRQVACLVFFSQHDPRVNGHGAVRECRQVHCFCRRACQSVEHTSYLHYMSKHAAEALVLLTIKHSDTTMCTFIPKTTSKYIFAANTSTTKPILYCLLHPLSSYILFACLGRVMALRLSVAKFDQKTVSFSQERK